MMWGVKAPLSDPSLGWCTVTMMVLVQLVKSIWCNNCPTFDCYCNAGKDSCPGGRDCIKKRGFNRKLYQTESTDLGQIQCAIASTVLYCSLGPGPRVHKHWWI